MLAQRRAKQAEDRIGAAEKKATEAQIQAAAAEKRAQFAARGRQKSNNPEENRKISMVKHVFARMCHPDLARTEDERQFREELFKKFEGELEKIERL